MYVTKARTFNLDQMMEYLFVVVKLISRLTKKTNVFMFWEVLSIEMKSERAQ